MLPRLLRRSFHPLKPPRMPTPAFEVRPPPVLGMNGGVPQPPAAPPGIGPPAAPNAGTAPIPSRPPSPPRIPPLPPEPAPPPANVTCWPVNNCISVAATREVTTSLIAVSNAVLNEFATADHTDCDF